jgi:pimeloyl-ACP methyl ester carboxylesterase
VRVDAGGLVFDVGSGGPEGGDPVILLHGFPQNGACWRAVAPALHAAGLRTYAPDQRGYSPGARPAGVDAYRIGQCAADVIAIADALGVDRFHLVGHDWGAAAAWHVAAGRPDRVRTLTAVSVPHPRAVVRAMVVDRDQRRRMTYFGMFRADGAAAAMRAQDALLLRMVFTESGLDAAASAPYVTAMREPGRLEGGLAWYQATRRADALKIGPVRVPTTFVWSDGDWAIGRTAAANCRRYVSADFRFVALSGISHWVPDQAPEALAEAILDRVRKTLPRGTTGG